VTLKGVIINCLCCNQKRVLIIWDKKALCKKCLFRHKQASEHKQACEKMLKEYEEKIEKLKYKIREIRLNQEIMKHRKDKYIIHLKKRLGEGEKK